MSEPITGADETLPNGVPAAGKKPGSKPLDGAKRINAQHLTVTQPTAAQLRAHYAHKERILGEERLGAIGKAFPEVNRIVAERDSLKIKIVELETELAEKSALLNETEMARKTAVADVEKNLGVISALQADIEKLKAKK